MDCWGKNLCDSCVIVLFDLSFILDLTACFLLILAALVVFAHRRLDLSLFSHALRFMFIFLSLVNCFASFVGRLD